MARIDCLIFYFPFQHSCEKPIKVGLKFADFFIFQKDEYNWVPIANDKKKTNANIW